MGELKCEGRLTHYECYEAENILAEVIEAAHREAVVEWECQHSIEH